MSRSIDSRPDAGEFAKGDDAALKFDILKAVSALDEIDLIDLSRVQRLRPYSVACLVAMQLGRAVKRLPLEVLPPDDPACRADLVAAGLLRETGDALPTVQSERHLRSRQVRETSSSAPEDFLDMAQSHIHFDAGVRRDLITHLHEVMLNALTHAESPIDCVVCGAAYPTAGRVEFAVVDLGITVRGHLCRNPLHRHIQTDRDAIQEALKNGVTGTPDGGLNRWGEPNSGAGLAHLAEYCRAGGGELTVLSGANWVTVSAAPQPTVGSLFSPFRGTLVNLRMLAGQPSLPPPPRPKPIW